jgi:hypothetical protein
MASLHGQKTAWPIPAEKARGLRNPINDRITSPRLCAATEIRCRFLTFSKPLSHLVIWLRGDHMMTNTWNAVEMVAHHRVTQNYNPHHVGQKLLSLPNEFSPMFVVCPGQQMLPTQISPPHTVVDAVYDLKLPIR